jgi:cell division septum initiation protein DivIVA
MGWGRYFFLGDFGQQLDLSDQRDEIEELRTQLRLSRGSTDDTGQAIAQLQAENDELRLYLAALVRLLESKGTITRDEVIRVVQSIDAEDGLADGKFEGTIE